MTDVEKSMVLYPCFIAEIPTFTVTWKNVDGSVLKTEYLPKGTVPSYSGTTPKAGTRPFTGWNPVPSTLSGPMTYYATYSYPNGMSNTILKGWDDIIADAKSSTTSGYTTGDTKIMLTTDNHAVCMELGGIKADSGSTFTWLAKTLSWKCVWNSSNYTTPGYEGSEYKTYMEGTILNAIPENIKFAMKQVSKYVRSYYYDRAYKTKIVGYNAKIWAPNMHEINLDPGNNYETQSPVYSYYDSAAKRIRYTEAGTYPFAVWLTTGSNQNYPWALDGQRGDSIWNLDARREETAWPCFCL